MPKNTKKQQLRRYVIGAAAVGVLAGGAAYGLPQAEPLWHPVTYGLRATPAQLLPKTISPTDPVRVVATTLDEKGRPVVRVNLATDRDTAADLIAQGQRDEHAIGVSIDAPMHAAGAPTGTDPYRGSQWDLAEMRVAEAWTTSTGAGVTVAVLDTGVDAANPDLAGQVLPGADLVDGEGDARDDSYGHGTHVAGAVAAHTGNGLGISSVAPDAKILPVRILDAHGSGYMSTAATGIVYAADHGADVINMSISSRSPETAVTNAIAYARSKGVVVVAAAGNERGLGSPVSYPGADPGVIAVAATDSNDTVASYSTRGGYVDVAAPGTNILSTYPVTKGYEFAFMSGTSMAAPHVAAVAALLKSRDRSLTPDQIEQAIVNSSVDLGAPGRDDDFGQGRIDAAAALATLTAPTEAPTTAQPTATEPTPTEPAVTEPTATGPATTEASPSDSTTPAPSGTTAAPEDADAPTTEAPTTEPTAEMPAGSGRGE
ncbi:S8 family serine peptidase [Micromonosporaceae bacterium Da 78-11]